MVALNSRVIVPAAYVQLVLDCGNSNSNAASDGNGGLIDQIGDWDHPGELSAGLLSLDYHHAEGCRLGLIRRRRMLTQ